MTCKHKTNGICGKNGPCMSPYCETPPPPKNQSITLPREMVEQWLASIESETDEQWQCNSYHPSIWTTIQSMRKMLK